MDSARVESDAILISAASPTIEAVLQAYAYSVSTPCFTPSSLFFASASNEELNSSARSQTVEVGSSSGSTEASRTRARRKGQTWRSQRRCGRHRAVRHHTVAILRQHEYRPNDPLFASARLHETLLAIVSAESHCLIQHGVVSKGLLYELRETPPPSATDRKRRIRPSSTRAYNRQSVANAIVQTARTSEGAVY